MLARLGRILTLVAALAALSIPSTALADPPTATGPNLLAYGLTTSDEIVSFRLDAPGDASAPVPIGNLRGAAEDVVGIDVRPRTGELFGVAVRGTEARVIGIDPLSGASRQVGPRFTVTPSTGWGVDFNPAADRLRVVNSADENFRINPDTGGVIVDGAINPGTANVVASAYNSNVDGTTTTTLYNLDTSVPNGQITIQNPPNAGTQTSPTVLSDPVATAASSFDIAPNGTAVLTGDVNGTQKLLGVVPGTVATGQVTDFGATPAPLRGLAFATVPTRIVYGLTTGDELTRFDTDAPGATSPPQALTGVGVDEDVVGIDFRPATGGLYGLGVDGTTARVLLINTVSGAVTQIGSTFAVAAGATSWGVDFNPAADRLRITNDANDNLRINPDSGLVTTDGAINPAGYDLVGSAYTDSVAGTATTRLYNLDTAGTDEITIQNPPNAGTQTAPVALDGLPDLATGTAFDVTGPGEVALVAASNTLYQLDVRSGQARSLGGIGADLRGLAVFSAPPSAVGLGIAAGNVLTRFSPQTGQVSSQTAITRLPAGSTVVGIDVRPRTGQLYGLAVNGGTAQVVTIGIEGAGATRIGAPFAVSASATSWGFDFNPSADRLRVVNDADENFRIVPDTGAVTIDGAINPAGTYDIVGSAYSENFNNSIGTVLFNLDTAGTDEVTVQNPANSGTQTSPVATNNLPDLPAGTGFDLGRNNAGFVTVNNGTATTLFNIDPRSGIAQRVNTVAQGSNNVVLTAFTLRDVPVVSPVPVRTAYVVTAENRLAQISTANPGQIIGGRKPLTGLGAGELIVGIDIRPLNGMLYGVAVDGTTARSVTIDTATGTVTPAPSTFTVATGARGSWGVDFNPVADRLRVINAAGENLSVNVDTGVATVQTPINPAGFNIVGSAYTPDSGGATTLYNLDSAGVDELTIQTPPAAGTQTSPVALTGLPDLTNRTSFDIAGTSGFVSVSNTRTTSLYGLDLATGRGEFAGLVGSSDVLRGLAVAP